VTVEIVGWFLLVMWVIALIIICAGIYLIYRIELESIKKAWDELRNKRT
jgi:hypothetical protein